MGWYRTPVVQGGEKDTIFSDYKLLSLDKNKPFSTSNVQFSNIDRIQPNCSQNDISSLVLNYNFSNINNFNCPVFSNFSKTTENKNFSFNNINSSLTLYYYSTAGNSSGITVNNCTFSFELSGRSSTISAGLQFSNYNNQSSVNIFNCNFYFKNSRKISNSAIGNLVYATPIISLGNVNNSIIRMDNIKLFLINCSGSGNHTYYNGGGNYYNNFTVFYGQRHNPQSYANFDIIYMESCGFGSALNFNIFYPGTIPNTKVKTFIADSTYTNSYQTLKFIEIDNLTVFNGSHIQISSNNINNVIVNKNSGINCSNSLPFSCNYLYINDNSTIDAPINNMNEIHINENSHCSTAYNANYIYVNNNSNIYCYNCRNVYLNNNSKLSLMTLYSNYYIENIYILNLPECRNLVDRINTPINIYFNKDYTYNVAGLLNNCYPYGIKNLFCNNISILQNYIYIRIQNTNTYNTQKLSFKAMSNGKGYYNSSFNIYIYNNYTL